MYLDIVGGWKKKEDGTARAAVRKYLVIDLPIHCYVVSLCYVTD